MLLSSLPAYSKVEQCVLADGCGESLGMVACQHRECQDNTSVSSFVIRRWRRKTDRGKTSGRAIPARKSHRSLRVHQRRHPTGNLSQQGEYTLPAFMQSSGRPRPHHARCPDIESVHLQRRIVQVRHALFCISRTPTRESSRSRAARKSRSPDRHPFSAPRWTDGRSLVLRLCVYVYVTCN